MTNNLALRVNYASVSSRVCSALVCGLVLPLLALPLNAQQPSPAAFTAWARSRAVALPDCATQGTAGDARAIALIAATARVVALGEPAHGAHEPLALRNCLFTELVRQQGFSAIGLESGLAESRRLQEYIAGGTGDASQLAHDWLSWGFGRFEENVELLEWLRTFNLDPAHSRKVHFYGIDMSGGERTGEWRNARITLDDSVAYLARVAPEDARGVVAAIERFRAGFTLPGYLALPAAKRKQLRSAIAGLIAYFDAHQRKLAASSGNDDFAWARRSAILGRQLEVLFRVSRAADSGDDLAPDDYRADEVRDASMADNVRWALEREGPAGRILLFAHDGHVVNAPGRGGIWAIYRRPPISMGQHLRAALGHEYRIVATSSASNGEGVPADMQSGTLDNALAGSGTSAFVLELRQIPNGAAATWLLHDQTLRTNFTTQSLLVPLQAMDAVAFLPQLTPFRTGLGGR